jgi:hypothetical protein
MLMGLAIWPVSFAADPETGRQVSVWWIYALAGGLSLVGVFLGQRWEFRQVARGLLFAAVGVLVYGLVTMFRDLGARQCSRCWFPVCSCCWPHHFSARCRGRRRGNSLPPPPAPSLVERAGS